MWKHSHGKKRLSPDEITNIASHVYDKTNKKTTRGQIVLRMWKTGRLIPSNVTQIIALINLQVYHNLSKLQYIPVL